MAADLVVGALLVDDLVAPTRILTARRVAPVALAGRWEFPGGKVEPGEDPIVALRRELREELAVELVVGEEFPRPGGRPWPISATLDLRLWFALANSEPVPLADHDELRWLTAAELHDVDWLDPDRQIVALLALQLAAGVPHG